MTDYRIVPVEPTEEMVDDFAREYQDAGPQSTVEMTKRVKRARVRIALRAMLSAVPAVDRQAVVETIKLNPAFMAEVMDEQQDWLAGVLADAILALFGEGE